MDNTLPLLLSSVSVQYAILFPLTILTIFTLMFVASLQVNGARASQVSKAVFSYLMQATGVLLMTVGSLPTMVSVLTGPPMTGGSYMAFLITFVMGGVLFLWQEYHSHKIDRASRAVPRLIFLGVIKSLGYLITIFSILSFAIIVILGRLDNGTWSPPSVLLLYGLMLIWCSNTEETDANAQGSFKSVTLLPIQKPVKAPAPAKVAVKKTAKARLFGRVFATKKKKK